MILLMSFSFLQFSGSNHFLVYSKDRIPEDEALNRLVLMANSVAVGLVRPGEEHLISTQMIKTAAELFGNHELLGAVTFGDGLRDSAPFRIREEDHQRDGVAYIDAAVSGPIFVNRAAFLQVGLYTCTKRERERERDRERQRHRDRQNETQREREREREREGKRETEGGSERQRQTDRQTDRMREREKEREKERGRDREYERDTERERERERERNRGRNRERNRERQRC